MKAGLEKNEARQYVRVWRALKEPRKNGQSYGGFFTWILFQTIIAKFFIVNDLGVDNSTLKNNTIVNPIRCQELVKSAF